MQNVSDLMTKKVITVHPETPLVEAAGILLKNKFNGLPVVDNNGILVGVLTEYDLVLKQTSIHLPTFLKIFDELEIYKQGSEGLRSDLKKIFDLTVRDTMNAEPLALPSNTSLLEVGQVFSEHHRVNPIPIVDENKRVVGIVSRHDLLKFLGDPTWTDDTQKQDINQKVDRFLNFYEKKFVLIDRNRTRLWFVASLLFAVVGFMIAWFLIIRLIG